MTVIVTLKGGSGPVRLENDFMDSMNDLQIAAAKGLSFLSTRTEDGDHILLSIQDILTIVETEDE